METAVRAAYRPRDAAGSPLYRCVLDHLETYLSASSRAKNDPAHPAAEDSLRSFLQCGIPRFGVARFRCKDCGDSRFVPFSCKRRMACPSCDSKRAVLESGHALEDLLPDVPYRQWVFVLPKRLRYFIHRDPRLIGAIDEIFARTLTDFHRRRSGAPKGSAPAQFHAIQRFGSSVNLHVHIHAALSDGCFSFDGRAQVPSRAPAVGRGLGRPDRGPAQAHLPAHAEAGGRPVFVHSGNAVLAAQRIRAGRGDSDRGGGQGRARAAAAVFPEAGSVSEKTHL